MAQDLLASGASLTANETIIVASTLHGMSGIAGELCPKKKGGFSKPSDERRPNNKNPELLGEILRCRGILAIEGERMKVVSMETLTGLRIFVITDPKTPISRSRQVLQSVYESYVTHVLKNPFCDVDMPVRLSSFEEDIDKVLAYYAAQTN